MSVRVTCSDCSLEISPDDVNVGEGVAYCRACGVLHRLAEILEERAHGVGLGVPPAGCRMGSDGLGTLIRASARSAGSAVGTLFVSGFWNGVVLVFVLFATAGTIQHAFGALPSWFPAPFQGSTTGVPLGMILFLWIFLLPFIAIGLILIATLFTTLFGRVEVRVRGNDGRVLTGFGPFTWQWRFDASQVKAVRLSRTLWKHNEQSMPAILIDADRKLCFGSILPDDRRAWVLAATRRLLVPAPG